MNVSGLPDSPEIPDILARFAALRVWRRVGERAPHKPLLVLWALGRVARGEPRLAPYAEVDRALARLLREFGPVRRSMHPELPFWHLRTDGVWEVPNAAHLRVRAGSSNPPRGELLARGATGGFAPEVEVALRADPALLAAVCHTVLDAHFPASIHEDLLAAVGLDDATALAGGAVAVSARRRDPAFRQRVLTAYERRCAVCGFDVRLGDVALGLDAAHIMWHQAGGPDTVENGLALCVLHHKLFDRGAFTLSDDYHVELSEHLHGATGFDVHLLAFHGRPIHEPQTRAYLPAPGHLRWHRREVFQGPPRRRADHRRRPARHPALCDPPPWPSSGLTWRTRRQPRSGRPLSLNSACASGTTCRSGCSTRRTSSASHS